MSGRPFLVSESVPRCFLPGLVATDVVDGAFRFCPLPCKVVVFEVDAGRGLPHVGIQHLEVALMVYFAQVYCLTG